MSATGTAMTNLPDIQRQGQDAEHNCGKNEVRKTKQATLP
jgi:hypothetical protein